jgi:hypothetical protein
MTLDSYDIRRSRVLSKWRGIGNFTAALVKRITEAYSNGVVSVTVDISAGNIIITFTGTMGIPPNLDDLKSIVDNVIPAHLGVIWNFTYLVYSSLTAWGGTYDQLVATGLTYDALTVWTLV